MVVHIPPPPIKIFTLQQYSYSAAATQRKSVKWEVLSRPITISFWLSDADRTDSRPPRDSVARWEREEGPDLDTDTTWPPANQNAPPIISRDPLIVVNCCHSHCCRDAAAVLLTLPNTHPLRKFFYFVFIPFSDFRLLYLRKSAYTLILCFVCARVCSLSLLKTSSSIYYCDDVLYGNSSWLCRS